MSQSNVWFEMQNTAWPAPSSTPVKVINVVNDNKAKWDNATKCLLAYGTSVPSGVAGYMSACHFIDTDAAADAQHLINEGTLSSCSFTAQTT